MRQTQDPTVFFLSTSVIDVAFTAAATDIITTGSAHGWVVGNKIQVTTSGTDLPAGLATSTDYFVIEVLSTTTIKISAVPGGTSVDITDAGTGTHTAHLKSRVMDVEDFRHVNLSWHSANSANLTTKVQGSNQIDVDFEAAVSATNRWDYVQVINKEDGSTIDGDTGIAPTVAGTDDNFEFAVNVDAFKWICIDVSSWTAGTLQLEGTPYND